MFKLIFFKMLLVGSWAMDFFIWFLSLLWILKKTTWIFKKTIRILKRKPLWQIPIQTHPIIKIDFMSFYEEYFQWQMEVNPLGEPIKKCTIFYLPFHFWLYTDICKESWFNKNVHNTKYMVVKSLQVSFFAKQQRFQNLWKQTLTFK